MLWGMLRRKAKLFQELALRLNGCVNLLHLGWSPAPPTLTLQRLELRLDGCERLQELLHFQCNHGESTPLMR